MTEPTLPAGLPGPRVVEGLVPVSGAAGWKRGASPKARSGSVYSVLNTVVEGDGVAGTPSGGVVSVQDVARVNTELVVLASAARTTTQTQPDQVNLYHRGIRVAIDVTDIGTGSITPEIDALDAASGAYIPILTGAAITGNGTVVLLVYPSAVPVANLAASDVLPVGWRIVVTPADANAVTYSVGAVLLV